MSNKRGNAVRFLFFGFGLCLSGPLPFFGRVLFFLGALAGTIFGGELFALVVCGCVVSFGLVFASIGFIGTASLLKIARKNSLFFSGLAFF